MRIISRTSLVKYWREHPETKPSLERWLNIARSASWSSMNDIQSSFRTAKVLNADRVRFEVHGGNYRLIVAFDFIRQIAFIKFVGTHKEYDRSDPLTVSLF
jgi:mRNA interferase HigB